ncbi:MAG: hypothetical protein AAFV69_00670 [Pseudomonadota bacterium]
MPNTEPHLPTVYVSITGLQLKGTWHTFRFWRHALPLMVQAKKADGNISADARTIKGIQHTLTVWESETAMKRFLYRGVHANAIRAFPSIATGKTYGFETTDNHGGPTSPASGPSGDVNTRRPQSPSQLNRCDPRICHRDPVH